jgi:hypothetical protein
MTNSSPVPVRHLEWDGMFNARDLGGMPTGDGRTTRFGAVVRAEAPDRLTPAGWAALRSHGIRTIIDLRDDDERPKPHPADFTVVHQPLDHSTDAEFWKPWLDSGFWWQPPFFQPYLQRFPQRAAAVISAIARAEPGGVLVHCSAGRDRAGLIAVLVLALAGVVPDVIADDYELSDERLPPLYAVLGRDDPTPFIREIFTQAGSSPRRAITTMLKTFDIEACLRSGGATDHDLAAVRARLLVPARHQGRPSP